MDRIYFLVIKRFIFFILLQGLVFNNFDLFGMYDPLICLTFNAAACLTIAFLRSYIMAFIFGSFFDPVGLKLIRNYISESSFSQKFLYMISMILIHHFFLFSIEGLSFKYLFLVTQKTLMTSLLTIIFCYASILFMISNEK